MHRPRDPADFFRAAQHFIERGAREEAHVAEVAPGRWVRVTAACACEGADVPNVPEGALGKVAGIDSRDGAACVDFAGLGEHRVPTTCCGNFSLLSEEDVLEHASPRRKQRVLGWAEKESQVGRGEGTSAQPCAVRCWLRARAGTRMWWSCCCVAQPLPAAMLPIRCGNAGVCFPLSSHPCMHLPYPTPPGPPALPLASLRLPASLNLSPSPALLHVR